MSLTEIPWRYKTRCVLSYREGHTGPVNYQNEGGIPRGRSGKLSACRGGGGEGGGNSNSPDRLPCARPHRKHFTSLTHLTLTTTLWGRYNLLSHFTDESGAKQSRLTHGPRCLTHWALWPPSPLSPFSLPFCLSLINSKSCLINVKYC